MDSVLSANHAIFARKQTLDNHGKRMSSKEVSSTRGKSVNKKSASSEPGSPSISSYQPSKPSLKGNQLKLGSLSPGRNNLGLHDQDSEDESSPTSELNG